MINKESNPSFKSHFANELNLFLQSKRALGYKYKSEARVLVRIDKCFLNANITEITEETSQRLLEKGSNESDKTNTIRVTVFRQFSIFLNEKGITAFIPARAKGSAISKSFIPYIFTKEQIISIISTSDTMPKGRSSYSVILIMPVMIRLLYCTGLRVSEATSLTISDINFNNSTITVLHSKNDNCRVVPISKSLSLALSEYILETHLNPKDTDILFPTKNKTAYDIGTIYAAFREILWNSGISHGGRNVGPRLHDIRHTFAVHSLQNAIKQDKDIYLFLPILSTYLGHKNIYSTEKYLRLTAEMYPDILEKIESNIGKIVPEVIDYEN